MSLKDIRNSIDQIDDKIIELLSQRMGLAIQTRTFKEGAICDESRELAVIKRVQSVGQQIGPGILSPEFLQNIFRLVIQESRRLQEPK
jgi:chorismate mutase